ncbi:hypothetical protein Tco_0795819 [Tanacetum coccineum]
MGDEHLSTILETESDEVIKSSVEDLVPIPSESEGISDDTCDVPFCDNSPPLDWIDDSFENIDYVKASPPDFELVNLEEVKDDILHEKLLNINLLIAKIESLNDNSTPDCVFKSPSPIPIPTFSDHTEETSSGSITTHADNSLPEYDSFLFETEPDQGELTSVVMEDILGEPRVHMLNVLAAPTPPPLMMDSDSFLSDESLGIRILKVFFFLSATRNKIFDPGYSLNIQSKRFLSHDTFSILFIRNPLCPVIETLLPFSSKNEDQVFNHGILSFNLLSHLGKITSDFSESPMLICGEDIPILNETATYGKIWYDEDVHNLRSVETEFQAIVYNDALTSEVALSCEPMVSPFNDNQIDFRISFDEFDDEDYTVIYDKNLFSYKIISIDDLKTNSENDNDKVNMPSFLSSEPTVSYDFDYFKDFEKEFPAIAYNDALTSKLDFLTEPTVSPQHIDELNLKNETSLSVCDREEQNVIYFNDLFPFNVIYPNDLKSDKDNDDNKIDIKQSLGDNLINTDVGTYAQGSNKLLETNHDTISKIFTAKFFIKVSIRRPRWKEIDNVGGVSIIWNLMCVARIKSCTYNIHSCS